MKILLVDDHVLFRAGLAMLLSSLDENLHILESGSCDEALALSRRESDIRICLLDLSLRNESGMGLVAAVKEACPLSSVIVVSSDESPATIHRALEEGAMGYIPKSATPEIMTQALRLVLAGGIYLPPSLLKPSPTSPAPTLRQPDAPSPDIGLSPRQMQVLHCLLRGWPNKLISRHMNLSENTIKTHLSAIYRALGITTRAQAVIAAGRLGIRAELESPASLTA